MDGTSRTTLPPLTSAPDVARLKRRRLQAEQQESACIACVEVGLDKVVRLATTGGFDKSALFIIGTAGCLLKEASFTTLRFSGSQPWASFTGLILFNVGTSNMEWLRPVRCGRAKRPCTIGALFGGSIDMTGEAIRFGELG